MTERELINVFQRQWHSQIGNGGQKFDPNFHQAIYEVPTSEKPQAS